MRNFTGGREKPTVGVMNNTDDIDEEELNRPVLAQSAYVVMPNAGQNAGSVTNANTSTTMVKSSQQTQGFITTPETMKDLNWYMDFGATNHVTSSQSACKSHEL